MAFVVSHMHRGIKAAKPNLLLLCHSVAVHTVIPAVESRQLLFFFSFFSFISLSFFFFPKFFFSSPYKGRGMRMIRRNLALPLVFSFPFYQVRQEERESSQSKRKDLI